MKKLLIKALKFSTVGASGAVIGLLMLYLLTDLAGWYYLASFVIASLLSITNNYIWNSLWTFKKKQANIPGYFKYLALSTITLAINTGLMFILTDILNFWYMASAIVVTILVFSINFIISRRYVWNKSNA